jgi:hypothetical protein
VSTSSEAVPKGNPEESLLQNGANTLGTLLHLVLPFVWLSVSALALAIVLIAASKMANRH